jgi:hypothetical protein
MMILPPCMARPRLTGSQQAKRPEFARGLADRRSTAARRSRVVGDGDVERQRVVEHAIGIERRRLDPAIGVEIGVPGEAELADVLASICVSGL